MRKVLDQDEAEEKKGGQFWRKQLLRKVTVFRPLHFSDSQHSSAILPQAQSFSEEDSTQGSEVVRKQPDRIAQVVAHSDVEEKETASNPKLRERKGIHVIRKHGSSRGDRNQVSRPSARRLLKQPSAKWHTTE